MRMMKEDLLKIRLIVAEHGLELTPKQMIELLQRVRKDIIIEDGPGLVTWLRQNGNNSTS